MIHFLFPARNLFDVTCSVSLFISWDLYDVSWEKQLLTLWNTCSGATKIHSKALLLWSIVYFTIVFYACSLAVLKGNMSIGPCCFFFFISSSSLSCFWKRHNNDFNLWQADINRCGTNNHIEAHDSDADILLQTTHKPAHTHARTHSHTNAIQLKGRWGLA